MNKHQLILLNYKNPKDIFEYCNKNNLNNLIDNNSDIWEQLIQKNYVNHFKFKHEPLCLKDYYVLLYYLNALNLINDSFVLQKSQQLLVLLNPIYEGDHICIIHASNNIAIRNNKCKVLMYRNKDSNCNIPSYGSGFLKVKYINNNIDIYSSESYNDFNDFNEPFNVHLIHGGYKLL
jgi:hypothetical protein